MKTQKKSRTGKSFTCICPGCGEKIYIRNQLWVGQLVTCSGCEDRLEIIRLDPVILDWEYSPANYEDYIDEELEFGRLARG